VSEAVLDPPASDSAPPGEAAAAPTWRVDSRGREYAPAKGRNGVVYRQGEETVDEAYERDAKGPRDKPPKKRARKPPAPTTIDLKELEHKLAEALAQPAVVAAMAGDEWAMQHFQTQAPIVARNLVFCAQTNPWLHDKLTAAMTGENVLVNAMAFIALGGALFGYLMPPIIYYLNPPFLPKGGVELLRAKYQIPEKVHEPPDGFPEPAFPPPPAAAAA